MDKPVHNDGPDDNTPENDQIPENGQVAERDEPANGDQPDTGDRPGEGADERDTPDGTREPESIDRKKVTPVQRAFNRAGDHGDDAGDDGSYSISWSTGKATDSRPPPPDDRAPRPDDGGWRGETGRYLTPEQHATAIRDINRVRAAEPRITADLRTVESEVDGARLVGLKYHLKEDDSLKDKVARTMGDHPDRSVTEIVNGIHDVIRYTVELDDSRYTSGVHDVWECLKAEGYTLTYSMNSWGDADYKGLNTRWWTPDGEQVFEVQFHTPESFRAKQDKHEFYERLRDQNASPEEKQQMRLAQREITSRVSAPAGVESIADYPERMS